MSSRRKGTIAALSLFALGGGWNGIGSALAQDTSAAPPAPTAAPAPAPQPAAATRTVVGKVVDTTSGEGVPLARINIQGTFTGVETDLEGNYTFPNLPEEAVMLSVTSVDHEQKDLRLPKGQLQLTVALQPRFTQEVVVVGRASEISRKNATNAVASVRSEELQKAPAATVDSALQGKIAGANIQSNSGAPGGGMQLRLRGVSTINGESTPLYVVDGVLMSDVSIASGVYQVTASTGGSNPNPTQDNQVNRISDLNPNDIESIEVLKGASAAAIYGSKASNGVVIITTKRGQLGSGPKVDVTQRVGMYQLSRKLGSRTFGSVDEAVETFGPVAADYYVPGKTYDNEQALAGRSNLSTETVASLSGALNDGATRYFASATVKDDQGIILNTGHQRQGFRLNLGQRFGERLEVNVASNLLHTKSERGLTQNDNAGVSYYMVLTTTPNFFDLRKGTDGQYPSNPFIGSHANPLQTAALMTNDEDVWRLVGSGDATLSLFKTETQELKLMANVGVDRFQQENLLLFPPELFFEPIDDGLAGTSLFGTSQVRNVNSGVNLVHRLRTKGGTSANTSIGMSFEEREINSVYVASRNLIGGQGNVDSGTQVEVNENRSLVRDRGYYVQEDLILFDEKWTVTGAVRGEQSSVNGNPNALFFYPKIGTAYRLPPPVAAINEFKLRAAYGETGNLPLYGQKFTALRTANIEGSPAIVARPATGDANIRPERQREIEAGLDTILLDGRAMFEVTVYQRTISDLLLNRSLAPSTGYTTQFFNGGELRNRGIELMLRGTPVEKAGVKWTTNATFALNRSEITNLPVPSFNTGGFGVGLGAFRIEKGASATQIVGNVGLKEDGTCCNVAKVGDSEPDFVVGWNNTVTYGDFTFSMLLNWQQGSSIINLTRLLYDASGNSPDHEAAKQRLKDFSTNTATYLEDASFVKVREISLTYQLPQSFATAIPGVKSGLISVSARNLLTFTNYSGLDPEVNNFGNQPIVRNIDVAPFPPSRSYWTSVTLGF